MAERLGASLIQEARRHAKKVAVAGAVGLTLMSAPSARAADNQSYSSADIPLNIAPERALEAIAWGIFDLTAIGGVIYLDNKRKKKPVDTDKK